MTIEKQVFKCLEENGFKRNINNGSRLWYIYESAKEIVKHDVIINNESEYLRAIKAISEYLNV
jgi:hypothetical protein